MTTIGSTRGHVKRQLKEGKRLTGGLLEFALSTLPEPGGPADNELLAGIARELSAGDQLTEYEYHVFVEVILLHVRLGAVAAESATRAG